MNGIESKIHNENTNLCIPPKILTHTNVQSAAVERMYVTAH